MKQRYFKFYLFVILSGCLVNGSYSQCATTNFAGNFTQNTSAFLSGIYIVAGTFYVPAGVTIFVQPFATGSCGKFEVHANKIIIEGIINGDFAGYSGGAGGSGGIAVTSLTGDVVALNTCSNADLTGQVTVQGGKGGITGNGVGGGICGGNGSDGSGPKQQCLSTDEAGMIGSGGGGGGGGGGSYGGIASYGGDGGDGTDFYQATTVNVSTGFVVVAGPGGLGGVAGLPYGTAAGTDIELGAGGAGGGGGARSFDVGLTGNEGGAGGGMVKLFATDTIKVSGTVTVNGKNGQTGGDGGNGGQSPKCCTDPCDDCGETTLSCGAGGGGGAGGGSGGGIYIETQNYASITGTLSSKGGNGGVGGLKGMGASCAYTGGVFCGNDQTIVSGDGDAGKKGGGGSGGRIKIFSPDCFNSIITPVNIISGGTGVDSASAGTYFLGCLTTTIDELSYHTFDLVVYPNPAQNEIVLKFKNNILANSVGCFIIYDISGREIKQVVCKLNQDSEQTIIISDLSKGIYTIYLTAEGKKLHQKFIKN